METLIPSNIIAGKTEPSFENDVDADWFKVPIDSCPSAIKAQALDTAFILKRQDEDPCQLGQDSMSHTAAITPK